MKTQYLLLIIVIFLASCNNRDDLSDAYGNFEANEVMVSSEISGKLIELKIKEGDKVSEGELVGIIDTTQLYLKMKQLIATKNAIASKYPQISSEIEVLTKQINHLEKELSRVKRLLKDGAATSKQKDDIENQIDVAKSRIEAIRTRNASVLAEIEAVNVQIEQVEDQIKRCHILNPVNGMILQKYTEESELCNPGKNIYKVAPLDEMILKVFVTGDQLPGIKLGQEVEVLIDKDEKENQAITGKVEWIASEAEFTPKRIQTKEERVKLVYAVKIRVVNDGKLKIGMPGEVNFTTAD